MSPEERLADVDLERLPWCTLAPSTRTRYAQALDAMLKFTVELGLDPNSADDVGLAFRRYLIESEVKQMAATTVRIRFYAVLKWDLGRGINMTNHWSNNPLVRAAIAGYCRNDLNLRTKEVRFPYSVGMVIQLQTEANDLASWTLHGASSSSSTAACAPATSNERRTDPQSSGNATSGSCPPATVRASAKSH
jgi:hypothetical protein